MMRFRRKLLPIDNVPPTVALPAVSSVMFAVALDAFWSVETFSVEIVASY